ncbi:DUF3800 domain-containing protein [Propioniferax innocua]|nr:DUF3800 domain-containing protein [Propioniferax innocua]
MATKQPRIFAYVDETGDRGLSSKASPVFGMAAVMVDDDGAAELRQVVRDIRELFSVPEGTVMSWKRHVKTHDHRRLAAARLGALTNLRVMYVYCRKADLKRDAFNGDQALFYNFIALKMYKSILWAGRNWAGEGAQLWTRFGHVRRHDHEATKGYILRQVIPDPKVPHHLEKGLRWVSADRYLESQAADLYGGFLKAAIWPDGQFNLTEPAYLLSVWHQIRNSDSCAVPLGIMSSPTNVTVTNEPWFPCPGCPRKETSGSSGASKGRST